MDRLVQADLPEVAVTESTGFGTPYRIWAIPVSLDVVLNEPVTARSYAIVADIIGSANRPKLVAAC
jgi:hypothetical protein